MWYWLTAIVVWLDVDETWPTELYQPDYAIYMQMEKKHFKRYKERNPINMTHEEYMQNCTFTRVDLYLSGCE